MIKHTLTEYLIAGLLDAGLHEIECKSRKYRAFCKPAALTGENTIFVGKAAAMRVGKNASTSTSVISHTRDRIIARGRRVLAPAAVLNDADKAQIADEAAHRRGQ